MAGNGDQSDVKLRSHMITDVGLVRDHNEDFAYVDTGSDFFVVADGMGGHAAGEVASAMAVETVRDALETARDRIQNFASEPSDEGRKELVGILESAVRQAHQAVYERGAAETEKQGMGTTLDVVMLAGPEAFVAHVGDSRTYLVRDGKAAQITTDHTVAEVLVIEGKLSLEEAQISPLRTILVNAIGVAPDVGVEMAHVRLRAGDQLLLCSDGLHDYFPLEQELADHLTNTNPERALAEMVDIAKNRGGHDNITGVVVEILDAPAEIAGLESTQQMPAVSDGVPDEVARGDTQPVDDPDAPVALRGTEDTLKHATKPRDADQPTLEAPAVKDDEPTTSDEKPARNSGRDGDDDDGEADMMETVRLKPLLPASEAKSKAKPDQAAKGSNKPAESKARSDGGKPKKKKRRRRKKIGEENIAEADTMPPYETESETSANDDDSDDTTVEVK